MPELPEVEILVRHLSLLLKNKRIHGVKVQRKRVIRPTPERRFKSALLDATFGEVSRRGKYILFTLHRPDDHGSILLVGHLGMTGRIYLLPRRNALPKHAAVVMDLGRQNFVYEDTRYFGRLTLDQKGLDRLGPEPLGPEFTIDYLASALKRSGQSIKVKLLDQSLVAGVGNIYAGEALFLAGISPRLAASKLTGKQVKRLWESIQKVLDRAIKFGSTLPLNFAGDGARDGLFYYGSSANEPDFCQERLLVYDRLGQPCAKCGTAIRRLVQAARSTYYCPRCQPL
jgi:formamidopyrimidine-DNA glycosylase